MFYHVSNLSSQKSTWDANDSHREVKPFWLVFMNTKRFSTISLWGKNQFQFVMYTDLYSEAQKQLTVFFIPQWYSM